MKIYEELDLMQPLRLFWLFLISIILQSCSWDFYAYIVNRTNRNATIDVFLLDKSRMKTLPNKIRTSDEVVQFKPGYRKYVDKIDNVVWVDINHFKYTIRPNSVVDLTDMIGMFRNGFPNGDFRVTVSTDKVDTLVNGSYDYDHEKFSYKHVGLTSHIMFYNVKD